MDTSRSEYTGLLTGFRVEI